MAETNGVVSLQIKNLEDDFDSFKRSNRDLETRIHALELATHSTSLTIGHMNEMMTRMEKMMDKFTNQYSEKLDKQNLKIDEFINSDKRRDSKKNLIVSIAQIVAGIIGTIGALWASGKL